MQMIEMHDVIMDELRADHEIAHDLRVVGHLVPQGVLHRSDGGDAMDESAHTADPLRECPRVTWIAIAEYDLDAPNHGSGGIRLRDRVAIHAHLDAQVPLDPGHGVDDDAPG